mgnify:CR=1 FL=1
MDSRSKLTPFITCKGSQYYRELASMTQVELVKHIRSRHVNPDYSEVSSNFCLDTHSRSECWNHNRIGFDTERETAHIKQWNNRWCSKNILQKKSRLTWYESIAYMVVSKNTLKRKRQIEYDNSIAKRVVDKNILKRKACDEESKEGYRAKNKVVRRNMWNR